MPDDSRIETVLDFWFGETDKDGLCTSEKSKSWWKKDETFDREIGTRFAALRREIMERRHEDWRGSARGVLAYVIVLDQFSRNLERGTAAMFEADAQALEVACAVLDAGLDAALPVDLRNFLFMPLMHSETIEQQDRCLALFESARASLEGPAAARVDGNLKAARAHREIIVRFGRFPHRNAVLGRECTPEEDAFLQQPGSSF